MAQPDPNPFSQLGGELYKQWEKNMTTWWDQVLDSPDFLEAMGKNAAVQARSRRKYEEGMDEMMERAHLPSRADLVRIGRICTLLEERLLQMEDTLLVMRDRVDSLEKEALQARIEAAEARLELREHLSRLQGRLEAAPLPEAEPRAEADASRRRGKGGS